MNRVLRAIAFTIIGTSFVGQGYCLEISKEIQDPPIKKNKRIMILEEHNNNTFPQRKRYSSEELIEIKNSMPSEMLNSLPERANHELIAQGNFTLISPQARKESE